MGFTLPIPKTVIIDFDGTLCKEEFPKVGSLEPFVREALQRIKKLGYLIKIHSCRTATYWKDGNRDQHIKIIEQFMKENELPYDEIIVDLNMDKPVAHFYVDDRAVSYTGDWLEVVEQIETKGDQ